MSRKLAALCLLAAACAAGTPPAAAPPAPAARLLFAGDVMAGRDAASVAAAEGADAFAPIRHLVAAADLAAANLESPLTTAPPATEGHDLRASPSFAGVLAAAGWDVMALANNHAGDGGPGGVGDTQEALTAAGLVALGSGATTQEALAPTIVTAGELELALLAVDLTGGGPAPGPGPGVAGWDDARVRTAVADARARADLVAVGVHGGAEGLPRPDPALRDVVGKLAGWGVDVVWAHGAHVVYATEAVDPDRDGRPTVTAYGLGDLVFDRAGSRGALLEVLAGPGGVRAWRVGRTTTGDGRVAFAGWDLPPATAASIAGEWWAVAGEPGEQPSAGRPATAAWFDDDVEVLAAGRGDATGDGAVDVVVAFLRPPRPTLVGGLVDAPLVDGRTAHLGVYDPSGRQVWVAGTLARPVVSFAVCDGALAVGYAALDGSGVVATGAWRWDGFGFAVTPELPGGGEPDCADVDGDGRRDPLIRRP